MGDHSSHGHDSHSSSAKSELLVAEKWDHCLENLLKKSAFGLALGFLPWVILKRPLVRVGTLGFGLGVGVGVGYGDCRYNFDNPQIRKKLKGHDGHSTEHSAHTTATHSKEEIKNEKPVTESKKKRAF